MRYCAAILAWLPAALGASGLHLDPAVDLARDARAMRVRRLPMLVLYSQADCSWCEQARRQFLLPMRNDPAYQERVVLRQVDIDSNAALTDFAGHDTTQRAFAAAEHARITPTVVFYGADGTRLAEAIIGYRIPDFYGAYLDRALDESLTKIRHGGR